MRLPVALALIMLWINNAAVLCLPPLEIAIKPNWQHLELKKINTKTSTDTSWILASVISFKKRINTSITIDKLVLSWKGDNVEKLMGSLYRKNPGRSLITIDEFLICDGIWNKKTQQLICKFEKPVQLAAYTELCFVLMIPKELESIIKTSYFQVETEELSPVLVELMPTQNLIIACNNA
jgi:hypothetical protein